VLDHVEDLPVATQPKLLRLIGERSYAPLGGIERTGDVRFVALGAADLPERVAAGTFRSDLFYRLEVVTYRLPPLRDRRADLPSLVHFFLADLAERLGVPRPRLAESAWQWLVECRWPGNLRQLRNLLEREMLLRPGASSLAPVPPTDLEGRPRSLAEAEEALIRQALAYTHGRQQGAADLLGISRKTLWEKRKRYGLP
jgi:DNA-binding NtrC family response regulator